MSFDSGDQDGACSSLDSAAELQGDEELFQIRAAFCLPVVYGDYLQHIVYVPDAQNVKKES